jgi:ATP-dependent helicase/nuclease subunit A
MVGVGLERGMSASASDPHLSAWVAANAGAGKTYTLANRVARLLLTGAKPERILCLTFTKAAAAEMQGRLFGQLGAWSMLPDADLAAAIVGIGAAAEDLPRARRLFAQALETPGGLKVLTIHAFCQIVLSRFPIEAGVPPGFQVLDDNSARSLMAEARQAMLDRAGRGEAGLDAAIELLIRENGEDTLNRILGAALGNDRRKIDRVFDGLNGAPLADAIWAAHGAQRNADPVGDFCATLADERVRLAEVRDWLNGGGKNDLLRAGHLTAYLQATPGRESYSLLAPAFLTGAGEPRKILAIKKLAEARPDLLAWLGALQERVRAVEEQRRAIRAAGLAEAALTLIAAVRGHYDTAKRRRGALDYDDLIVSTLNLLAHRRAAPWVQFKLDGGIDHILIDEAQDTSPEQWAIIQALTEEFFSRESRGHPRTLFAVGDEKQSIFSFQGADPREFEINRLHFRRQVGEAGLSFADVPLTTSRRSAPEILAFVDRLFESDVARAGLTSRGLALEHQAHRATARGGIEFWSVMLPEEDAEIDYYRPVDVAQRSSPIVRLAESIAGQIQDWIRRGVALPGRDTPIRPGDIMILLPRREPFGGEVIRQLKLRNIPVAGADRIVLTEQIAVMDLIALGRFVLQREDDLNLAALLRSPLCGLSEEELFALCHGREGGLWRSLLAAKDGHAAFEAAHIFLSEMLERADYAPPFEFFTHALTRLGKRRDLLARLGTETADAIEEFLSLSLAYERNQTPSLEGFLDWIGRGGNEIKRDMERGRDEVRVMTVHGAKGLEADIVILPDTTGLPEMPWLKGHLLYADGAVLFPASGKDEPAAVAAAKIKAKEELLAEHRRLLYVALTRARDRLYICGFQNSRAPAEDSWYRLAAAAAEALGKPLTRGAIIGHSFGHFDESVRKPAEPRERRANLPAWMKRPAPREGIAPRLIRPSDALDLPEPATLSPLGRNDRFKRGNIVHTLLARLADLPPAEREAAALTYVRSQGFGPELVAEIMAVLNHPEFASAFADGSRAEVAFLAALPELGDGAQVNGRIDRLAVTQEEVLILDFKTNRPPPAREEDVSPVYLAQMALYRAASLRIFPGRRIVCGLVWTDGPVLMRLSDAILDRQLAGIAHFYAANRAS